jgi:ectoine hydroxylase-related dioxygenase (phytanoyl-CoA dioxygenase family)
MTQVDRVLDHEQVESFQRCGFVAVEQFFSPREVAALQADVARLQQAGKLRNVSTTGDGATPSDSQRNLQLCPAYEHSRLLRALPFHPRVLAAVGELIGDPLVLQLDQVFLKPAGDGMGTSWHQDNAYFQIADPTKGVAMWVAIHDATIENGTLHVVPECFQEMLEHQRDPYSDHHIRCYPPEEAATPLVLKAGGVGFFYFGTPHCTRGNTSSADRAAVAFHFVREDFATEDVKSASQYHPVLTGSNATDGAAVYGEKVAGTWDVEVDQLVG